MRGQPNAATPVFYVFCVLTLRCQECKSPYVRRKHVISEEELFPFWSPRPSKSITGNRMLKREAVLTLRLLVPHAGLCLIPDRGGKCRCSSLGNRPGTVICVSTSLGTLSACAHSSSPVAAVQAFTDVPPRKGSCSSQPPGFHLPGGLAPPICDGAADSSSLPQPILPQGLSCSNQRKRDYSTPFSAFPLVSWLYSYTLDFFP